MTEILVTGAGGYVGGRLTGVLKQRGCTVRALVREPAERLGVPEFVLDLADAHTTALDEACNGVDAVIHLAGENEVTAARQPAAALASTVVATERLAEAVVRTEVPRFIYMSTVHVYGERIAPQVRLTEDLRAEPRSSYAISRLASEHAAASLANDAFDLVVFRLTNSIGAPDHPRVDRWTLVANDLCRQVVRSGRLELRSAGVQWRDFVPLLDVCETVATAATSQSLGASTYNLGSGESHTIRQLATMIQDEFEAVTGSRPPLDAPDAGPEDTWPEPYEVSVDRLRSSGLVATSELTDAVAEIVGFCVEHEEELP
ncbi:MAG: UDP-glucose 4-epimerase [Solirubrobacterales bacterium]|nr:UDP-glucose 4-epimerase [Solirubrobacterales bacterium]